LSSLEHQLSSKKHTAPKADQDTLISQLQGQNSSKLVEDLAAIQHALEAKEEEKKQLDTLE